MIELMKSTLNAGLAGLDLPLSPDQADTLCAFGAAVVKQNEVMNLTAITEPSAVAKLHLLDSVSLLKCENLTGKTLIDVGCGAGFPGVPVKIACPEVSLTLLDSLGTAADEMDLGTVEYTVYFDDDGNISKIVQDFSATFSIQGIEVKADYHTVTKVSIGTAGKITAPADGDSFIDVTDQMNSIG